MVGKPKPSARDAFEANLADAITLVTIAEALSNKRKNAMRREKREALGRALRVPRRQWDELDCIESDDLFVIFKPGASIRRTEVTEQDLRPLLRQALVAACAAAETFVADRAMELLSSALKSDEPPRRLLNLSMTIGSYLDLKDRYQREGWGIRQIVDAQLREMASTAPNKIGEVMSTVGVQNFWRQVNLAREVERGESERQLEVITERRNRIAHTGDRKGNGRATISVDEVRRDLEVLKEIIEAIDEVTAK